MRFKAFNDGLIARAARRVYIISPRLGREGHELRIYAEYVTEGGTRVAGRELDPPPDADNDEGYVDDDPTVLMVIAEANASTVRPRNRRADM